ncbi:GntR family transcriptional regulator, partial [Streptomyces exfoliatus]|uniref:GntR family transcriptional regulator n=1 Tax=Streptomyces exfoliatus TaxID=1905 RepID=UPI00055F85CE
MPAEPASAALPLAAARRRRLRADRARQLADLLRHQILAGGFPDGVLPLEDALAADYRASRNTVRQALDLLRGEQIVARQPGVGNATELASDRGPVYLKLSHLPEETIGAVESILHTTERPTRGTFHEGRGHDYRTHDIEMHISEIGLCGGHSASGVRVDAHARTTVPRLYAAGDLASVPHNYMIGAFVFGDLAGEDAARFRAYEGELPADQLAAAHELVYRPLRNPDGPPQPQVEYKLRRFVNDYVAPPKTGAKLSLAVEAFTRMSDEIAGMGARTAHELMRCAEVSFIRDCAEMAARASLARTESRWGLYHERLDHPERDDQGWLHHLDLRKSPSGAMEFTARPVEPYVVPVAEFAPPAGPERPLGEVVLVPVATAGPRDEVPAARPAGTATAT